MTLYMQKHLAPFITIEGVDGAGKSSHVSTIIAALEKAGFTVVATREPGGTEMGSLLRAQLKTTDMSHQTAALIAFADRSEHLAQKIRPALASGKAVLSDRFTDSTYAYQGGGDGCDWGQIETLENMVHGDCQPDLTLFFDLPTEVAEARRERRKAQTNDSDLDKFDEKSIEWFDRVRSAYLRRVQSNPARFSVVDSSGTLEEVAAHVQSAISEFVQRWPEIKALRSKAVTMVEEYVASDTPSGEMMRNAFVGFLQCQSKPMSHDEALLAFVDIRATRAPWDLPGASADLLDAAECAMSRGELSLHAPLWGVAVPLSRNRPPRP